MRNFIVAFFVFTITGSVVVAQSGSGEEPVTVEFAGKVRLPNETFTEDLNDDTSPAYLSFRSDFEDQLIAEIKAELDSKGYTYSDVRVAVTNFTEGSVNVAFLITIDGTTISVSQLAEAAAAATADSTIGSLTSEQIQDLNECAETSVTCANFAQCVNTLGSFRCDCDADYYDQSGNGTICVTPATVLCEPKKIEFSITKAYLDNLNIDLADLRLADENCSGIENTTSGAFVFTLENDIASCGTEITENSTHVTYSNALSNKPKSDAVIQTGSDLSIPFSCSYSNTLNATLDPFEGEISSINITGPEGNGEFNVGLYLYETDQFVTRETKTKFLTTDNLYVQAEMDADDSSLTVVLERCWATPSNLLNDSTSYDVIENSCAISSAVDGTVNIISNGDSGKSRFSVQVFKFVSDDTTYIHCSLRLCSTANGSICKPTCGSSRRRRDISALSTMTLSRSKRNTVEEQDKTVGPFYRETVETVVAIDVFWGVVGSLIFVLLVLLLMIACLMRQRRSLQEAAVVGLKLNDIGLSNVAYS